MFSLPLLPPPHDFLSHLPHTQNTLPTDNASLTDQQPGQNPRRTLAHATNSTLLALKAEEEAIRRRKENIARFGSTWIRPPGVAKTLQAETEERLEREEQEALARREEMMADMQAQQEREELAARAAAAGGDQAGVEERDLDGDVPVGLGSDEEEEVSEDEEEMVSDEEMEERDLDEEVPEADEEASEIETTAGEVSFNDVSLIEGSMLADRAGEDEENSEMGRERVVQERMARIQEAEMTGARQEEIELGMDANLDDSVPEAGSYEHTDTELEDDTSEIDGESFSAATSGLGVQRSGSQRRGLFDNARRSAGGRLSAGSGASRSSLGGRDASSLLESSFVSSSPVVGRLRSGGSRGGRGR